MRRVCVLGIGDGGSRAVEGVLGGTGGEGMIAVINTDPAALAASHAVTKIQIGKQQSAANGTGGDPLIGKAAAERDIEMLRGLFTDCDALILAASLGGGTGTGASPVLLGAARAAGVMTIAVVTTPFQFESQARRATAQAGLQAISAAADFVCVIENDRLLAGAGAEGDIAAAFARADEALAGGICSLWHILSQPMLISVDPSVFMALAAKGSGVCRFGFGTASGAGRAQASAKTLKEGPVFEQGEALRASGAALLCICGSHDMTLQEVADLVLDISASLPADADLQIATVINEAWRNRIFAAVWLADRRRTVTPTMRPGTRAGTPAATKKHGTKPSKPAQEELKFEPAGSGRGPFKNMTATILDGEDLDTPTYKRRGIVLER
jgi:cell division protein FtsZ